MLKPKDTPSGVNPYRLAVTFVILLAFILSAALFPRISEASVEIQDPRIDSSFLFSDAKLTFSGSVDKGCDVIVKIAGQDKKVVLGTKGLLPSDYTMVDNLPGQYKIMSSGSLSGLSPEIKRSLGLAGDFGGLKSTALAYSWSDENKVLLTGPESEKQVSRAINLNERNGSYRTIENSIRVQDGKFTGTLNIGRQEYSHQLQLEAIAIKDNVVVGRISRTVKIGSGILAGPIDIEKEPLLFAGFFFCLTVLTAVGAEEIFSRARKTAYR